MLACTEYSGASMPLPGSDSACKRCGYCRSPPGFRPGGSLPQAALGVTSTNRMRFRSSFLANTPVSGLRPPHGTAGCISWGGPNKLQHRCPGARVPDQKLAARSQRNCSPPPCCKLQASQGLQPLFEAARGGVHLWPGRTASALAATLHAQRREVLLCFASHWDDDAKLKNDLRAKATPRKLLAK